MKSTDSILIRLLAKGDAVWLPIRAWQWPLPTNLYFARQSFANGTPWHVGGESAERKRGERDLVQLADAGFVEAHRPQGKTTGVSLTPTGEARARGLAGLPSLEDSVELLLALVEISISGDCHEGGWIWEGTIGRVRDDDSDTVARRVAGNVEAFALPGLWRRWLDYHTDGKGCGYIRPTSAGWDFVAELATIPTLPRPPRVKHDHAAENLYRRELNAARARLAHSKPAKPGEVGFLPLPVSLGLLLKDRPDWQPDTAEK
jgi:hypothetical protein